LTDARATADFRHEALLYRGDREFVEQVAPFVIDGIANGEPTLIMVFAVSEVATNSITHGGGRGVARIWMDGGDVVCEVSDRGVINDPLVDRQQPGTDPSMPRGLWTANQLCDLVQLRSSRETGSVVRLLVHAGRRAA